MPRQYKFIIWVEKHTPYFPTYHYIGSYPHPHPKGFKYIYLFLAKRFIMITGENFNIHKVLSISM